MARPYHPVNDGITRAERVNGDASMRDLLRQLANDGRALVRDEITLAKVEMKTAAKQSARDSLQLVAALAIVGIGGLALTAAAIIGIGIALGGLYWAAALIVGALFVAVGGLLARRGIRGLQRHSLKPDTAVRSLQRDRQMVRQELRELRHGLRS
jgi:hypothetical protein